MYDCMMFPLKWGPHHTPNACSNVWLHEVPTKMGAPTTHQIYCMFICVWIYYICLLVFKFHSKLGRKNMFIKWTWHFLSLWWGPLFWWGPGAASPICPMVNPALKTSNIIICLELGTKDNLYKSSIPISVQWCMYLGDILSPSGSRHKSPMVMGKNRKTWDIVFVLKHYRSVIKALLYEMLQSPLFSYLSLEHTHKCFCATYPTIVSILNSLHINSAVSLIVDILLIVVVNKIQTNFSLCISFYVFKQTNNIIIDNCLVMHSSCIKQA